MNNRHAIFSYFPKNGLNRLITAVSLKNRFWYPAESLFFYRSSGDNSTHANTWFPCQGVSESRHNVGWIIKPQGFDSKFYVDGNYPESFLEFVTTSFDNGTLKFSTRERKKQREMPCETFLARFGNIDCLLYSFVVGGGFWDNTNQCNFDENDSRVLSEYLKTQYAAEIQQIKAHCQEIKILQHPHSIQNEYHDDFSGIRNLNNALSNETKKIDSRISLTIHTTWKRQSQCRTLTQYLEGKTPNKNKQTTNNEVHIPTSAIKTKNNASQTSPAVSRSVKKEHVNKVKPRHYKDENTWAEIGFIIASLGMYAYLKNCIDKREENLSSPTAIAKIALAVLLPPVAMIIGTCSLFCSSTTSDSREAPNSNNKIKRLVS